MPDAPNDHVYEIGVRNGLQNLDIFAPTETKYVLIGALVAAGVREIDASSFVARVVPQFVDVDATYFVIPASKTHNRANVGRSIDEEPDSCRAVRAVEAGLPKARRRAA